MWEQTPLGREATCQGEGPQSSSSGSSRCSNIRDVSIRYIAGEPQSVRTSVRAGRTGGFKYKKRARGASKSQLRALRASMACMASMAGMAGMAGYASR